MAGIGADIASVMEELGDTVTILRLGTTEKVQLEVNAQASNAFLREFLVNASLSYITRIVQGDVVQTTDGNKYVVIHKAADNFEGEVVEYISGLLKCNTPSTTQLMSPVTTLNSTTFAVTNYWNVKSTGINCLVHHNIRSALNNSESSTGKDTNFALECFIPASCNAEVLDRLKLSETEYFRVQSVEKYEYNGVHVLTLVEDERENYHEGPIEPDPI